MTIIMITKILLPILIVLAAAAIFLQRRKTRQTMDTIEEMLDAAMEGHFSEKDFDESRLSALESRFAHYLSASAISAGNVAAEKEKIQELISDISHQTKTPLTNILLYGELLAEEDLTEEAHENVNALRSQTEKLRFLIDSLVKLSRLENGILTLQPECRPVQPMLAKLESQFMAAAKEKGIDFCITDTDIKAVFDEKWTGEALANLIDNAVKYTERGSVTVSVTAYELFVRIDVKDTGIGIAQEEQPKIFQRFYRSEQVKEKEGVGIGLYLARQIVSLEGGYMKVSTECGKGSVFSVFLPR